MENEAVTIVAKYTIQPSHIGNNEGAAAENPTKIIHLTPSDLRILTGHYIQRGILFHKPENQSIDLIISELIPSLSLALNQFFPFAGRFSTTHHENDSISVSLHCNNKGAEFIHANASHIKVSDILTTNYYIPPAVCSFFPLNGLLGHDGHSEPLLGVQVTELSDGIFIACSLNHSVADGNSFWQFFNTWSSICRTGNTSNKSLEFDKWFPHSVTPPILFSSEKYQQRIKRLQLPHIPECMFHFSSTNVTKLKAKANQEMSTNNISSLQALMAHVWRSVTRALALDPEQKTTYMLLVGCRPRVYPALPDTYIGNYVIGALVNALVGEVESKGIGWAGALLNQAIASKNEASVVESYESWTKNPWFLNLEPDNSTFLLLSSSPRFNVYGNDFGWGRPVAVRSGPGNKSEGKMAVYPGVEDRSIDMEITLPAKVMSSLLEDKEFMEFVG